MVAGLSTLFAAGALLLAFKLVYRDRPKTAAEPDPMSRITLAWRFFSALPLDTLYMKGIVPLFNKSAYWLAHTLDGAIWHDFFHDNLIRNMFVGFAAFSAEVLDMNGIDGLVNGSGQVARRVANLIRLSQTGYARNYALSVFLGTVALLAYFLFIAN
jgi:NADH-quinone oxidoreductase subunit L